MTLVTVGAGITLSFLLKELTEWNNIKYNIPELNPELNGYAVLLNNYRIYWLKHPELNTCITKKYLVIRIKRNACVKTFVFVKYIK